MFPTTGSTQEIWIWPRKNSSHSAFLFNVAQNVIVFNESAILNISPPVNFSQYAEFTWYEYFTENWTALVTLLITCIALTLNTTILLFGCRRRSIQSLWFILHLASSDLVVNLLNLPKLVLQVLDEPPVPVLCLMQYLAWGIFAGSSMGGIVLISVTRWWAAVDVPITQSTHFSKVLIGLSWAVSLLMGIAIQLPLIVPYSEFRLSFCSFTGTQYVLHKYATLFEVTFLITFVFLLTCNLTRWDRLPGNRVHPTLSIITSRGHRCNADCICSDQSESLASFAVQRHSVNRQPFDRTIANALNDARTGDGNAGEIKSYFFTATCNQAATQLILSPVMQNGHRLPDDLDNGMTGYSYSERENKPMEHLEVWPSQAYKHLESPLNYSADTSELSNRSSPVAPKMQKPKLSNRLKQMSLKHNDHEANTQESPVHASPELSPPMRRRAKNPNSGSSQGQNRCCGLFCHGFTLVCKCHTQNWIIIFAFLAKCLPILILLVLCANGSSIKALPIEELIFAWMTFVTLLNPLFYGFQHPSIRAQYRQIWRRSCLLHA